MLDGSVLEVAPAGGGEGGEAGEAAQRCAEGDVDDDAPAMGWNRCTSRSRAAIEMAFDRQRVDNKDMLSCITDVLDRAEIKEILSAVDADDFVDGRSSAGFRAKTVTGAKGWAVRAVGRAGG